MRKQARLAGSIFATEVIQKVSDPLVSAQLCKMINDGTLNFQQNISFIALTFLEQVFIGLPSFPWTKKYQAWIELGEEVPSPLDDAYSKEALGGGWAQAIG